MYGNDDNDPEAEGEQIKDHYQSTWRGGVADLTSTVRIRIIGGTGEGTAAESRNGRCGRGVGDGVLVWEVPVDDI